MSKVGTKAVVDGKLVFTFVNDEVVTIDPYEEFTEALNERAMFHGYLQKLGDSYSGNDSIAEALMKFNATLDTLRAGDWNRRGGNATGGIWVEAIARATGDPIEKVLLKWNAMDEDVKKSVKAHPDVVAAKAEIELERAKAKVKASSTVEPLKL